MDTNVAFEALDECVSQGCICKLIQQILETSKDAKLAEKFMEEVCSRIEIICKLWPKVLQISKDFLAFVAKDNASRYPPQSELEFNYDFHRSWHQFAIESLRYGVQNFVVHTDRRVAFLENDLTKLLPIVKNLNHLPESDVEYILEQFPDYNRCKTGLLNERDNCLAEFRKQFDKSNQINGGRESSKLTPEVIKRILMIGRNILRDDKGISKLSFWDEIKRKLDQEMTDAPGVHTMRKNFDYDKSRKNPAKKLISGKHW